MFLKMTPPIDLFFKFQEEVRHEKPYFIFKGNITEVRRQIGNAVPPLGVRPVAKRLMPLFTKQYTHIDTEKQYEELKKMTVAELLEYVTNEMN